MLPANARVRRSEEFRLVIRRGRRAGRRRLVVHALTGDSPSGDSPAGDGRSGDRGPARAGFVVSKAVGGSVVRHRVVRRLRHLMSDRLGTLPPGSALVVRALPPAADASSAELGTDLDSALRKLDLVSTRPGGKECEGR